MITGEALTNTLVDELNDLGLPNMAATLDSLYRSERFLKLDHLSTTIYLWLINLTASKELSILLLSCIMMEQSVCRLPFLDLASV